MAANRGHRLQLDNITQRFGDVVAVQDINLEVAGGELVALLGPSGCGKSTLLRIVSGFIRQTQGRVLFDGEAVDHLTPASLVVALWTTVISVVLGTAAALGIARSRSAWVRSADVLFMSPLLLPALAFGFAALVFISRMGFSPSIPFLVLGHVIVCVPFVLRTTTASLSQLDPALLDASYSLGGSWWMTFRRVTLPLIAPGVASGAFLCFMASFDNVPVSLFLSDERTEMLPIHLWQQIDTNLDVRTAAVSGLIVILTPVLMLVAERMAGLTKQLR